MASKLSGRGGGQGLGTGKGSWSLHPVARALAVFEQAPIGLAVVDDEGGLEAVNPRWCELLGQHGEALLGRPIQEVLPVTARLDGKAPAGAEVETGWRRLPAVTLHAGPLLLTTRFLDEQGRTLLVLLEESEFAARATRDPLTGLSPAETFHDRVRHAIERADRLEQPLALLMIELDGYAALARLDQTLAWHLLRQVSRRMARTFRGEDSLGVLGPGRWGVMIEHPVTPEALQIAALRFQEAMEAPFELEPRPRLLTASIGIACYPLDAEEAEGLFAGAEEALRRAMAAGPGSHAFQRQQLHSALDRRAAMRLQLQEALLEPSQHFHLRFQPLVAPDTGRCLALETLIRWDHPRRGTLQPRDFLPLVAEMGEAVRLDRWVLERVIHQRQAWKASGSPLAALDIAVNLAGASLEQRVFDGRPLDHFLRRQQTPLDWLLLEMDAAELMARGGEHLHLLKRLRQLGVRLVADELDRAPLTLETLAMLPLSHAKIGRGLVSSLGRKPTADRAFGALLSVLETLQIEGMLVGVETEGQRLQGSRRGIVMLQGNLIAPPLEVEGLGDWVGKR